MIEYSNTQIEGVLDYGRVLKGPRLVLLWCCVFIPLVFPLITLGVAITVWSGEMSWELQIIIGLICANGLGLVAFCAFSYLLVSNVLLKKHVDRWLDDSIEVQAFIQRTDLHRAINVEGQLEISFNLDGLPVCVKSTANLLKKWKNKMFLKYVNSEKKVLYSPKYKCILFPIK